MRYSKRTLLLFGAGLLLGLAVVSANLTGIGWVASLAMAASLLLLPLALVADWWSHRPWRKPPAPPRKRHAAPRPKAPRQPAPEYPKPAKPAPRAARGKPR